METYPLDIAAEQVVRWLVDETRMGRRSLQIRATRAYADDEIPNPQDHGLGQEEREDVTNVTAVGILEIFPTHRAEGWLLRVRVEDALGRRLPEDASVSDTPEEIELASFQDEFVLPDRGTTFVAVEADSDEAWSSFQTLLDKIRANKHAD